VPPDLAHWVSWFLAHGAPLSLLLLTFAAAIEYIFPPFPGDTVVLAGAVLATRGDWNLAALLLATTAGSVAGAWLDFRFGSVALRRRRRARDSADCGADDAPGGPGMERVLAGYRRWGVPFLALNRFFPGIRALFFVAAGMAGMRTRPVLLWAAVSALAWNTLLLLLGVALGNNLERLQQLLHKWSLGIGGLLLLLAAGGGAAWAIGRRRRGAWPSSAQQ
jgi:membrane-associated protein